MFSLQLSAFLQDSFLCGIDPHHTILLILLFNLFYITFQHDPKISTFIVKENVDVFLHI